MKNHSLHIAGAAGPRVDGIDVAQLLHDMGEASATSSAVDLFGLCLNAQRVLACVHVPGPAVGTGVSALDEAAWLTAFRKMDDRSRRNMLIAMQAIAEEFPRRPPASLTLVQPDQHLRGGVR